MDMHSNVVPLHHDAPAPAAYGTDEIVRDFEKYGSAPAGKVIFDCRAAPDQEPEKQPCACDDEMLGYGRRNRSPEQTAAHLERLREQTTGTGPDDHDRL